MENNNRQGCRWVKQDEEQARLKAEERMPINWDRKDSESVGLFYNYYIQELFPFQNQSLIEENKRLKEELSKYQWTIPQIK